MTPGDPVVAQIQLGILLRELRETAGLTGAEAAEHLRTSTASISRYENGKQAIKSEDVAVLLDLYGASDRDAAEALRLAAVPRPSGRRRRSASYRDEVPNWFRRFLVLEGEASDMSIYEHETVTGLCQTKDYARVLLRAGAPLAGTAELDRQVAMRTGRQEILTRTDPPPPRLDVVLNELCLHRVIGDDSVMHAQLQRLLELSEYPEIELRILPFRPIPTRNYDEAFTSPQRFTLLRLPERGTVLYLEDFAGANYPEDVALIQSYAAAFQRLRAASADLKASRDLIARVARQYV
ncbi:helix-turn-helix domain-containing protein [Actinokineospora iranica]|uniref:Helix-turn-helix domain-containing protein n=1 Tax=Actinokineospora iranica TaxID=1271860 RepID=A0A1G6VW13_9PSEU|nr:helix-turn-helix transcriptional regulator [Actinokineospora iranica]SDD57870.1 Helix-turn-helix domain-containing protein [Actinokineospora iranica]